jgi:class 3 adenylate cyclase
MYFRKRVVVVTEDCLLINVHSCLRSSREPTQVFILLEAVYHEFDLAAKRKGVFKVETIGDSYVAVTGKSP